MVVILKGNVEDQEYSSAKKIKELFELDESLKNNPQNKILIVPSVQCYGQQTQDIDVVIMGELNDYKINIGGKGNLKVKNFCCVVENKRHSPDKIEFSQSKVYAITEGKKRCVSQQSIEQKHSLRKYILNNHITHFIWVSNIIYLPFSRKVDFNSDIPEMNVIFKDSNLEDFWKIIIGQKKDSFPTYEANYNGLPFEKLSTELTKKIESTRLDRIKVDQICKEIVKEQKYGEKLGEQLLIFRGRGGTGKTYRLLNLAYKLYNHDLSRVLILTYNHALISDIKRLFAIMGIRDGIDESIQIKSLYSFWYSLFYRLGIRTKEDIDNDYSFGEISNSLKEKTKKFILDNTNQINELKSDFPNLLDWDYVMVDEAQDWPKDERELLYLLFPPEKIVVADGYDQLIRSISPCNWKDSSKVHQNQSVSLIKSMRQKSNIVRFLKVFSNLIGIRDLNIEAQDSLYGGQVMIINGEYTKDIHDRLTKKNKEDKNENVDFLFCVHPKLIDKNTHQSQIAMKFDSWKCPVWDGIDKEIRKGSFATDVNQFRIVQYDSCRGLEGWITINLELDEFYSYKLNSYVDEGQLVLKSLEDRRKEFAANWLLIPLTRSIDTLVIQIKDSDSFIGKILREIYEKNKEYVEWIE